MKYYLYILTSLKDTWHYTGHASDVPKRVQAHNSGKVKSTKSWRPFKLIYTEEFNTRSDAFRREMFLKSPRGAEEKDY
ncbi:MAG: GIY-YIG nuclease family protein [Bacteroidetes bacterium]|nr:GIY-YIG nuclease family protein [Bacteroidota bacterium]MCL5739237.1 GIY-YIG nuclease family protein [Bacteroidota bacterium]